MIYQIHLLKKIPHYKQYQVSCKINYTCLPIPTFWRCQKSVILLNLANTAHSKSMEIWCESCLLDWKSLKTASAQKMIKGATTQNMWDFKYVIFIKDFMGNNPWFHDFMVYKLAISDNLTKNVLRKRCGFIDITDMHF